MIFHVGFSAVIFLTIILLSKSFIVFLFSHQRPRTVDEEEIDKLPNIGLKTIKTTSRYQTRSLHDTNIQNQSKLRGLGISSSHSSLYGKTFLNVRGHFFMNVEYVINILSPCRLSSAVTDRRSWSFLSGFSQEMAEIVYSKEALLNSLPFKLR